ncbi:MarC family protein, partial [Burkholderia stabilis]
MAFDLTFSIKVFAALFAIMNPIANIPVFLSLTQGAPDGVRRKVALTAAIGVTIGCIVSAVAGGAILRVFGLTIDDFRLAGGLLVLLIALSMLHGAPSRQHSPGSDEGADPSAAESMAIYPLTIPLLVGPGTIATMIVLGHGAFATGQELAFALGLAAFLVLLAVALLSAPLIGHYLSPRGAGGTH